MAGWICFDTGQPQAALAHFSQGLGLAQSGGASDLTANIHYRIGRVHLHHNDSARALTEFGRGENVARDGRATLATSLLVANQAWSHATLGHADDTLQLLGQAVDTFERAAPGHGEAMTRSRALSPTVLAINHFIDDDADRGAEVGTQALEMAARLESPPHPGTPAAPAQRSAPAPPQHRHAESDRPDGLALRPVAEQASAPARCRCSGGRPGAHHTNG
ncbi:hypothetical protein [Lentzea atacamensis]|uniref:hypothetical protein n=1 Tax=Lentzea atacamensis TaxID=531938 RepID=UPI0011B3F41A|nr:hypothetical protein [Lentzea atacamensis]